MFACARARHGVYVCVRARVCVCVCVCVCHGGGGGGLFRALVLLLADTCWANTDKNTIPISIDVMP